MRRVTPQILNIATRLMSHEVKGDAACATLSRESFQVFEKLRPSLATLMGNGGFRALLTRALALAKLEFPWLRGARVNADGTLDGWDEPGLEVEQEQVAGARIVLLAQLLSLLVTFIGANLTRGLVRDVWPQIQFDTAEFGNGDKYEKTE